MKTTQTILELCHDKTVFGPWFKKRFFQSTNTWTPWFSFMKILFGLEPLLEQDVELYRQCTGRNDTPSGFTEAWLCCGRRGGKSFVLSVIAVYLAAFKNWQPYLQRGERATIAILAKDRAQCQTIFRYIVELIQGVPMLAPLIQRQTNELIELTNGVNIEISTASFRTIRGRTICAALLDEVAFWSDEGSNPDAAVLSAIRPAMGTIPGAMLLCASSPYSRRGALYDAHRRYFGKDGSDVLIWQAGTRVMNPSFKQSIIDDAMEKDPADANAEYMALFRSDLESYVDRDVVMSLVASGSLELPPVAGMEYYGFVDPAGGSGSDSMAMAVAHKLGDLIVLDCVREVRPGFSPQEVVKEFSAVFKSYGISRIVGDAWGGGFVREPFAPLEYVLSKQNRSEIYRDGLALLNSRRVELRDHNVLISQLCNLERRTGSVRDTIDHPKGQHDDIANAAMGAILLAANADRQKVNWFAASDAGIYSEAGFTRNSDTYNPYPSVVYTGPESDRRLPPVNNRLPNNTDFLRDGACDKLQE